MVVFTDCGKQLVQWRSLKFCLGTRLKFFALSKLLMPILSYYYCVVTRAYNESVSEFMINNGTTLFYFVQGLPGPVYLLVSTV